MSGLDPARRDELVEALADPFDEWLFRMHGVTSSCQHEVEAEGIADALAPLIARWLADDRNARERGVVSGDVEREIVVRYVPGSGSVRSVRPDANHARDDADALRRMARVVDGWADRAEMDAAEDDA